MNVIQDGLNNYSKLLAQVTLITGTGGTTETTYATATQGAYTVKMDGATGKDYFYSSGGGVLWFGYGTQQFFEKGVVTLSIKKNGNDATFDPVGLKLGIDNRDGRPLNLTITTDLGGSYTWSHTNGSSAYGNTWFLFRTVDLTQLNKTGISKLYLSTDTNIGISGSFDDFVVDNITAASSGPTVSSVAITSATGIQNSTLNAGDVVTATVTMSAATTVNTGGGTPTLGLNIGGTVVQAAYASGSGTTSLTFQYTIQAGQADANGISIDANGITLNGGTLKDGSANNATTTFSAVTDNSSYKVDTTVSAPSAPDMTVGTDSGSSSTDNITNDTTPTFSGTAEAGATVTLYDTDGTTSLGSATATGGNWSITSSALSAGAHTLTAKAVDLAGNISSASTSLTATIDADVPTGFALSSSSIAATSTGANATVGTLSATDSNSVTYALATGNGTNDANNGSFNISGTSLRTGGSLAGGSYKVYVSATDVAGNVSYLALTITVEAGPTVTDANISITSTPSGTSSTYKIGDTVTAKWNNTAGGENQSGVTGVTMDFSAFGGGAAVAATNDGSGNWTASYQIVAGSIDGTSKNVSVSATSGSGTTTTADTTNLKVDNQAPTVTDAKISLSGASGTSGAYKIGDTVTATWNNTAGGDNNSDISSATVDFSAFGGGSAVAASNSSGTWTATYTVVAGSIDGTNKNVSFTVTDDAGNATTTSDTTNAVLDNIAPTVSDAQISISGATGTAGAFKIGDTVTATWNNTAGGENNSDTISGVTVDFSAFGGGSAVAATNSLGTWTATYTIVAGAIDGTNKNVSVTATDNAGNTKTTADTTNATVDNVAPTVTDAKISISGASGASGVFKTGDTVTATWNNTGTGDNNSDTISGVTVDFSQFGGGSTVAASNSAGTWIATYTIVEGSINRTTNRNVSVTATDNAGNATTIADTTNATVDNQKPVISSVALNASTYKIGDTITATITIGSDADTGYTINTATIAGHTFGNLTRVSVTSWTATYTVLSGDTDLFAGNPTVNLILADAAGNLSTAYSTAISAATTIDGHAPTDMTLSSSTAVVTAGSTVGSLSTTDTNSGAETFTYTLVAGAGSTDNADFQITGSTLKVKAGGDITTGSKSVRIRVTDAGGNTYEEAFAITAVSGPTVSAANLTAYADTSASDTYGNTTGTIGATANSGSITGYGISGGTTGGTSNIGGTVYDVSKAGTYGTMYVKSSDGAYVYVPTSDALLNQQTATVTDTFTVQATDSGGTAGNTLTITINGANDAPTDIALNTSSVNQSGGANATVGTMSTTDADSGQSYTYTLVAGNGTNDANNGSFNFSGSTLRANNVGALAAGTYHINVRTTDNGTGSLHFDKAFTVTVVDDVASTVSSASAPSNASYKAGQNLDFVVNFNENMTVVTTGGTPRLALTIGSTTVYADYVSGSGTSALTFRYTIQAGDTDTNGITVGALSANGGTIKDAANNNATLTLNSVGSTASVLVDTTAATVSNVTSNITNATYKAGDAVSIQVLFSENVIVTGTPQLTLETGTTDRTVNYASGSGTNTLTFTYTVQSGDVSSDLDFQSTTALALNSGTIKDVAGNDATLTLAAPGATNSLGANKAIVIDAVAPTDVTVTRSDMAVPSAATFTFTLDLSDVGTGIDSTSIATGNVTVTGPGAMGTLTVTGASYSGSTATYTVQSPHTGVWNSSTDAGTYTIGIVGTQIKDLAGNYVAANATAKTFAVTFNQAPANSALPVVTTAAVGSSLSVTDGTWSDVDNDTLSYTYQWYRANDNAGSGSAAISGATSSTYTATTTDAHKYLRVVVTANDGHSHTPTANSAWTLVTNTAPVAGTPSVSGTLAVGSQLTAATGTWTDADTDALTYSYQWYRADDNSGASEVAINGATSSTYTLTTSDAHKYVKVKVTANDSNGSSTVNASTAYVQVGNSAPTNSVVPAISGTATVGNALTTTNGTWSDPDVDTLSYSYQWYRSDDNSGTNSAAINGATASSYTLTASDAHKYLNVVVTANDAHGSTTQTATSSRTAITNTAPVVSALSNVTLNETQTATPFASATVADTDHDNVSVTITYTAANGTLSGTGLTGTAGNYVLTSTDATTLQANLRALVFTPTVRQVNAGVVVTTTFSVTPNDGRVSGTLVQSTAACTGVNYEPTGIVTVTGTTAGKVLVGDTLTASNNLADVDGLGTITYTWKDGNGNVLGTGTTLTVTQAMIGKAITATASYTDGRGSTDTKTSAATSGVLFVPPPVVEAPKPVQLPQTLVTQPSVTITPPVVGGEAVSFLPTNSVVNTQPVIAPVTVASSPPVVVPANAPVPPVAATLTIPTPASFQVVVAPRQGGSDALVVNQPVRDAVIAEGGRISVRVPAEAFAHTRADAQVNLTATRTNGAALPGWMSFNSNSGTFEGTPPPGFKGVLEVKVVARDSNGREAVQTFKIVVGAGQGQLAPQERGQGERPGTNQGNEGRPAAPQRSGKLDVFNSDADQLAELINLDVKTFNHETLKAGRPSLADQFKKASRPLGSSERLAALSKAVEAARARA